MERIRNADCWFFWLFALQAVLVFVNAVVQSTKRPAVAMNYLEGYGLILLPYFFLLLIVYVIHNIPILVEFWKRVGFREMWSLTFSTTWAKRVNWMLGLTIVVNLAYQLYTRFQLSG